MNLTNNYMATKDSNKNLAERSDDNMSNKRKKTDSMDNQLLEFSTANNHYSIVQQVLTDIIDKVDHAFTLQTAIPQTYANIVKSHISCLETLPNELLFHIFSYIIHPDIVQIFFGLNQRFNSLSFEFVRQLKVLIETPLNWYVEYLPKIKNAIETISLDVELISRVFSCNHSYPNLRFIILKDKSSFTVKLNVQDCSGLAAVISCLNLLRICCTWTANDFKITPLFQTGCIEYSPNTQMDIFLNTLPCPAIEGLSAYVYHRNDWIYLCDRAPNLNYLKINWIGFDDLADSLHPTVITSLISRPSHLTNLHIILIRNLGSFESIEWLISCCQSSLRQFTLESIDSDQINGIRLEKLLQPCRELRKLVFRIEFGIDEINMMDMLNQFQTDWWLDPCRPPVFLHRNSHPKIYMVTMPCTSLQYIELNIDPNMWLLSKGQLDSSLIYFSKVNSISIKNNCQQPVTFDFLRLIGQMFRSSFYNLNFTFWDFDQSQKLYEQISNTTSIIPQLPHVQYLNMVLDSPNGLDAISLVIWLLAAPNVKELYIVNMSNDNKLLLANDLERILKTNRHLKIALNRIERIILFPPHRTNDDSKRTKLFFCFLLLFPEAVIDYL